MKIRPAAKPQNASNGDDIVIVVDDPLVRVSLIMMWHGESGIRMICEARDAEALIRFSDMLLR